MTKVDNTPLVPNGYRLLWAGFMAIFAAGVGFAIRGGIFDNWGAEYGFTAAQLGAIGGAGFSGFCFGIIIGGVTCDKFGYGRLVVLAFALHVLSAIVTFTAHGASAYTSLYWGMFIFAYANGTLEAVANPLVATLYPGNRTLFLNGVLGSLLGLISADLAKYATPVSYVVSGALLIVVSFMTRFSIGSFLLFTLFIVHALVGSVELGTDGWIQNITGNLFTSAEGKWLFIWTSVIMFSLRFCAHFIERTLKLSPVGLLFVCAAVACIGLQLSSGVTSLAM